MRARDPSRRRAQALPAAAALHQHHLARRSEYVWIGGPSLLDEVAAGRLGVSARTIARYRAELGLTKRRHGYG